MDPAKCYRFSRKKIVKLSLKQLLKNHPDSFYQILDKTAAPLAILSYAGWKQDLVILRAVLEEHNRDILSEPPNRISSEYNRFPPKSKQIFKMFLKHEPKPNCTIS